MERDLLIKLVTRVQAGDSQAFEELYDAFYEGIHFFANQTVKDEHIAWDIVQETFIEVFSTIGNLKEPAAFVAWMKQIAYHQCTRYFKKRKDVLVEEDEDGYTVFDTLADESEDSIPSEVYEKEEFRRTIMAIIDALSEEQRAAVLLYYFDELTVGQIAQIQGVSEGTVKSRLNYARKAIKKSVEDYEKKYGIKLHSISFLPLFLLAFGREKVSSAKVATVRGAVMEKIKTMGGSAAVEGAGAAVASGLGAKIAAMPVVTKILAGVVAATVALGGAVMLFGGNGHACEDADGNGLCDACGGEIPVAETEGPLHYDPEETGADGYCDHCGEAMCFLGLGDHRIAEGSCVCELCYEGNHTEGENHPFCGVCRERLPIDDKDGDGACDVCGEYSCGGSYHGGSHTDEDGDSRCDICRKSMCGLIWGLEHNYDYSDGIYDGKCDDCGGNGYPIGWGEDDRPHGDANGDGVCDCCDRDLCDVYGMPEYGGVDADGDEKCDICGFFMCDGHGLFVYHYDFDQDEKCDRCDHYICAHGFLPHTDEDRDERCEKCYSYIPCVDEDRDGFCDVCQTGGFCYDDNNDGICDLCGRDL